MKTTYVILILLLIVGYGCNRNDLNTLHDVADDHTERLKRLEEVVIEGRRQLDAIHTLLLEYDRRTHVTHTKDLPNGGYMIYFSDGDSTAINDAITPVIEISAANTWTINGNDTGVSVVGEDGKDATAPLIREQNGTWEISTDKGENWQATGIPLKGETGENAAAPTISIGANKNWFINGNDTGCKAIGSDGKVVTATPRIEARLNEDQSANWWISNDNDEWTDTGIKAIGAKGETGSDGKNAPYVTQVTVSGEEISFTFSDIIPTLTPLSNVMVIKRIPPFKFEFKINGTWVGKLTAPLIIPVDEQYYSFECRVTLNSGENAQYNVQVSSSYFDVRPEFDKNKVRIGIDSRIPGFHSGFITLRFTNDIKETYTVAIPIQTEVLRLDADSVDFTKSYVYHINDFKGNKMAEVCGEYLPGFPRPDNCIVYPFNSVTLQRNNGYATRIGGIVDANSARYSAGIFPPGRKHLYLLGNGIVLPLSEEYPLSTPITKADIIPERVTDIDGNAYALRKIGTQYWTTGNSYEGLQTTRYNDGSTIAAADITPNAGQTTYSVTALLSEKLAPAGWHIPSDEEWKIMEGFLGMPASEIDLAGQRGDATLFAIYKQLHLEGTWYSSTIYRIIPGNGIHVYKRINDLNGTGVFERSTGKGSFHIRCIRNRS